VRTAIVSPCQLLFVERAPFSVHIDLVALESFSLGNTTVSAGSPIALGLKLDWARPEVGLAYKKLADWASDGTVVNFHIVTGEDESMLLLSCRGEQIVLATSPGLWSPP
jgi:hypothetical protein